ncbi:hypothetical protein QFZ48_002496 [Chitinophaga sp. W2I13]
MPNDDGYDYWGGGDLGIREHIFNQDQVIYSGSPIYFLLKIAASQQECRI